MHAMIFSCQFSLFSPLCLSLSLTLGCISSMWVFVGFIILNMCSIAQQIVVWLWKRKLRRRKKELNKRKRPRTKKNEKINNNSRSSNATTSHISWKNWNNEWVWVCIVDISLAAHRWTIITWQLLHNVYIWLNFLSIFNNVIFVWVVRLLHACIL